MPPLPQGALARTFVEHGDALVALHGVQVPLHKVAKGKRDDLVVVVLCDRRAANVKGMEGMMLRV